MAEIYKVQIEDESGNIHYPHTTADVVFLSDGKKAEQVIKDLDDKKHTHSNKTVIDKITQALLDHWSAAYTHVSDAVKHITSTERANWDDANSKKHTHSNKSVIDKVTQAMLDKLAGIATGANNYVHPTTAGNKHIPAGGASGQFLKWSADGTAVWGADNNTTYGVATQSANGLMVAADKKKLDGVAAGANNYVHPSSHPASMITQDSTHRFATDAEKANWNEIEEVKQSLEKYASITVAGELLNLPGGGDIAVTGEILTIPLRI